MLAVAKERLTAPAAPKPLTAEEIAATKAGIIAGMVAGFTVCVGWKLAGVPFGLGPTVPGAIACAAALVGVSLSTYRKAPTPFLDPYQNTAGR